jgi:uncharacterized protein YggE
MIYLKILLLTTTLLLTSTPTHAQSPRKIEVSGTHTEKITPDIIKFTLSVQTKHKAIDQVQKDHLKKLSTILNALSSLGIKDIHIKTQQVSIQPEYNYKTTPPTLIQYTAGTQIQVTLIDISKFEKVTTQLTQNDISTIGNIQYDHSNKSFLYNKALTLALQNAKQKATQLALSQGLSIGHPLEIIEQSQPTFTFQKQARLTTMSTPTDDTYFPSGELEIEATLRSTFELLPR